MGVSDEKSGQRFSDAAREFVLEVLHIIGQQLGGHITGPQLVFGIGVYARMHYGIMGVKVLEHFGLTTDRAIGECVFEMVDLGIIKAQPSDRIEDFYDTDIDPLADAGVVEWPQPDEIRDLVKRSL